MSAPEYLPKVELIPLTVIKPYWRNPRDNNESSVAAVVKSIGDYKFNSPIILDSDNVIINGHTRFKAAQEIGMESVPCVILTDLSPEKVREYRIADNKSSELSKWNDNLMPELRELVDISSMQVYFGNQDLSALIIDPANMELPGSKTQDKIDDRQKEMEGKFQTETPEFIEATCPHCLESFNVDKAYVIAALGMEPAGE